MQLDLAFVTLAVAILVNFGGIVWGAATISSSVRELRRIVGNLTRLVEAIEGQIGSQERRLTLVEWRLDNLREVPSGIAARRANLDDTP